MMLQERRMKNTEISYVTDSLKPAVLCDFDDTTVVENVASLLLSRFSGDSWLQIRERYLENSLTFKEYQEEAFSKLRASKDMLKEAVREEATLRPYFKELWQVCFSRNIPLAILTIGLDFYVEALLEREGLEDVPVYAVGTRFLAGCIDFIYNYTREGCETLGNCKCVVLDRFKNRGHFIVYVGDGRSDFCPASKSDLVFARSYLADCCEEQNIDYVPFKDFKGVIQALKEPIGPPSSHTRSVT